MAGDGTVFVSLHSHHRVDRYRPGTGELDVFCQLPAPAAGLAFDTAGTLWVTGGEVGNPPGYVWRVRPDGTAEEWVRIPPGEGAVGSTACAFGRTPQDGPTVYVTTNGGLSLPYEGKLQDAKLLRLTVGEPGQALPGG